MDEAQHSENRTHDGDVELSIVVPVFEEESTIGSFLDRTIPVLENITSDFEIIFVLDPGRDETESVILSHIEKEPRIRLLCMTRRWGQPACTAAGIENCRGEACVVIDVDLQDPPELIPDLVAKWREGFDVVFAQRRSRAGETLPKRFVSWVGYWVINRISEVPIPRNTGDFRLMDRKVVERLKGMKETHGFLRGLVAYVGYTQTGVAYDRDERLDGVSKYSQITGSMRIGLNGVVAFSSRPLTLATVMGFIAAGASLVLGLIYVGYKIILNQGMVTGMAPVILMLSFFGGVQLICIGIIGEYIGRIYEEVRDRPKYMIDRKINFE